jgi:hypothetical protein
VGEAYILRSTILFSLCKYEEMRQTLTQFFTIYDPIVQAMQSETTRLGNPEVFYRGLTTGAGMNRAFINYSMRDEGIKKQLKVIDMLREEKKELVKFGKNESLRRLTGVLDEAEKGIALEIGQILQKLHKRKLADLMQQREQANYLKVEIVTGEKELIETQKGLPPKRVVDVETSVAAAYHFWPYQGEFWEDELGAYVYTTESACVN